MPVPHDLLADLNLNEEAFQALVDKDPALHALHKDYNAKDKAVLNAEKGGISDDAVTQLRKERLLIKDRIERLVHPPRS